MVEGTLSLPYAEIKEPFSAMYDSKNKMSRIDYYGSTVVTIQRGDMKPYGVSYKLAPMTTYNVTNKDMCFQVNGTKDGTVDIQSVLPDLTGFTIQGNDTLEGKVYNKWVMVQTIGKKKNTYSMWVDPANNSPKRYEMMGYDTLLGSHYDKYYLDYMNYNDKVPIKNTSFSIPTNMTCGDFPGPGAKVHHVLINPMREYMHRFDLHVEEMFQQFKDKHSKMYNTKLEHLQRKHNFRQNVRFIHSKNRAGLGFSLAVNHLTDKSSQELKMMNGYRYSHGSHGGLPFDTSKYRVQDLPTDIDWRLYGAVTPVKDQGVCGSCWSFGTTGTIEGAYFMKTGNLVRLSQQELMDCSWGEGNNACDGGEDFRAYMWMMKSGGITSEEQYGQYLAADSYCHTTDVTPVVAIKNYVNVTMYDQQALKFAVAHQGPISVAIDASHKSLSFYSNGVYYEPQCGNKPDDLDHAVLAVGYGVMNGQAYWLIKNSWSTYWGMDGYVLMSQKDNNCGVRHQSDLRHALVGKTST
ncbi:hypothetical protein FSP39_023296 [Pinctada imbricata]|uniref:Counting factor associated protein D n=1 Tax=Pinctada imbricata TaxID=66713 RepID=A0AA89BY44_PINIB|nr:hypothetical protein FSP39_023296 [Pinctada imbricata]